MDPERQRYRELADFLRTRRERLHPSQLGLPSDGRRRTPGLRREEVAQLAGVGLTWYTWLEQGREIRVSTQVVESLARVLRLDRQERNHLYLLANQPLPVEMPANEGAASPILRNVLESMALCPSLVTDQRWNVIAWNKAACALLGELDMLDARGRNIVWAMFIEPKYRQLYVDWEMHAKILLGKFRATCGQYIEDTWLARLVEDLKGQSPEFNRWWSLHEIQGSREVNKRLNHPEVGLLEFDVCNFDVSDHAGLKLIVHTPAKGTDTEEKMRRLLEEENDCE